MKRKLWVTIVVATLIIIAYFVGQYIWLTKTNELRYRNLAHMDGTERCYIFFNVENHDSIYTVVMPGYEASELVREKSRLLHFFYPLYMKEVMAHNFSIGVDDSMFSNIKYSAVDPIAVNKFHGRDIEYDTSIFSASNALRYDIEGSDFNAIIYLSLKNGSNCCVDDYSGATFVSTGNKFINK